MSVGWVVNMHYVTVLLSMSLPYHLDHAANSRAWMNRAGKYGFRAESICIIAEVDKCHWTSGLMRNLDHAANHSGAGRAWMNRAGEDSVAALRQALFIPGWWGVYDAPGLVGWAARL
jgi:hypothetical protein